MSISTIAGKHGGNQDRWKSRIEPYHNTHPEWCIFGMKTPAHTCFYYHPDLVALLLKEYTPKRNELDTSYDQWMSASQVTQKYKGELTTWKIRFEAYHNTHREWWVFTTKTQGRACFYYHPDLIAKVVSMRPPEVKKGWLSTA